MAFSKLIHADLLSAVQKVNALYTGTGNLSTNKNVDDYTEDAKKAVIFTDDNYIVTHGHLFYTGLPFSVEAFPTETDSLKVVSSGILSGLIVPMSLWQGNLATSLSNLTAGTRYGVLMDSNGHAFVAVGSAQTNSLVMSKGSVSDLQTKDASENTVLISDTTNITYNPGNTETSLKFVGGNNQFSMLATYKTAEIDENGEYTAAQTTTTEKLTIGINPVIQNNVIADVNTAKGTAGADGYVPANSINANNLVIFSTSYNAELTGENANNSVHIKDSGFALTADEDGLFSKTSGNYTFESNILTTEAGVRDYVTHALGDITGAMRYKGNTSDAISDTDATTKWVPKTTGNSVITGDGATTVKTDGDNPTDLGSLVKVEGLSGLTPYLDATNNAIKFKENSDSYPIYTISSNFKDYQLGDVYYAANAMAIDLGDGVYRIIEKGDLLVATTPEKASASTTPSNAHWTIAQSNWTAADGVSEVKWNETTTLATIGGVNIDIKMPSSPESKVELLFKAGLVDIDTTATNSESDIAKHFTYTGDKDDSNEYKTGVSHNGNTTLSIATLTKTIDGSTEKYTPGLFEINVKGERDINVRTNLTGDLLIGHTNRLTSADIAQANNANIADVTKNLYAETDYETANEALKAELDALSFYKVSFDEYGHVNKAISLSNSLTFHTYNAGAFAESTILTSTGDKPNTTSTEFNGFTKNILINGVTNGDVKIEAEWSTMENNSKDYDVLTLTPTITKHFRGVNVNGVEFLGEYNYTALDLVAGTNVRLATDATTGSVTISAVDTWRSIGYRANVVTDSGAIDTTSSPKHDDITVPSGAAGDAYNDTETTTGTGDSAVTTIDVEGKTIGQNRLVFGTDFYITEDATSGDAEVSIEWCEITATKTGDTVTGATIRFTA